MLEISICLIEWLLSASAIPEISFTKVAGSSLMQSDRLRAAKTLSSCFLELQRGCHRSSPVAMPGSLLVLYVFSCSEHLTKDNLFECLMLRSWLVEDYMRWPSDLWWLVVGKRKYVCQCMWGSVWANIQCRCVCAQFQVLALTQTLVVFHSASSEVLRLWQNFLDFY